MNVLDGRRPGSWSAIARELFAFVICSGVCAGGAAHVHAQVQTAFVPAPSGSGSQVYSAQAYSQPAYSQPIVSSSSVVTASASMPIVSSQSVPSSIVSYSTSQDSLRAAIERTRQSLSAERLPKPEVAREQLVRQMQSFEAYLGGASSPNAQAWFKFLKWNDLLREVASKTPTCAC